MAKIDALTHSSNQRMAKVICYVLLVLQIHILRDACNPCTVNDYHVYTVYQELQSYVQKVCPKSLIYSGIRNKIIGFHNV